MRRLISIAALALFLSVPVWAQRGGGGHMGGGGMHGGGFAGRGGGFTGGGHMGGGRSFVGVRSGGMQPGPGFSRSSAALPRGSSRSFNRSSTNNQSWGHGFHGHSHHHFNNFTLRNYCYGYSCRNYGGGGWGWGWGWSDPWLWSSWDDQDRRFDQDYYGQYEMARQWNEQNLAEQQKRREEEEAEEDAYAPRASARRPAPESSLQSPEPAPATVLVFRDQHRQEVQNYAVVGQTLWAFSTGRTQKIPLADLDIPATQKANDDRGVTFHVPGSNEGQ